MILVTISYPGFEDQIGCKFQTLPRMGEYVNIVPYISQHDEKLAKKISDYHDKRGYYPVVKEIHHTVKEGEQMIQLVLDFER